MAWFDSDEALNQNPEALKFKLYLSEMVEAKKRRMSVSSSDDGSTSSALSAAKTAVNTMRYKTEMCRSFAENGYCRYGDKCQFAHGLSELRATSRHPRYKTEMCKAFHSTGFCAYGARCNFIHKDADLDQVRSAAPQLPVRSSTALQTGVIGHPRSSSSSSWEQPASTELWNFPGMLPLGSTVDSPPQSVSESPVPSPSSALFDSTFDAFPSLWTVITANGNVEVQYVAYGPNQ